MNKKVVEYFEKYQVAPSPNRDYYGIKILRDEIILFLWKISHGPHRTPVIRVSKFFEFASDKSSQDEIQRIFGNYLLEHVRNISERKLSLLTLPKHIIAKITNYLRVNDILNLSTLSHISKEVFDNDTVWQLMYKMLKGSKISPEDRKIATTSSWKQLIKEKQLQETMKSRESCEAEQKRSERINSSRQVKKIQNTTRKCSSKAAVSNSKKKIFSKSDAESKQIHVKRITSASTGDKKILNQTKIMELRTNENILQQPILVKNLKTNLKPELPESIKLKTCIGNKNIKSNETNKQMKNKNFTPLINQKKASERGKVISTATNLKLDPEDNFSKYKHNSAISSLIEENLNKMKSPRSIFNYDFSVLDDKKLSGDSGNFSPKSKNLRNEISKNLTNEERRKNFDEMKKDDEISSDVEMERLSENYLKARDDFMKSMNRVSNLSLLRSKNFPNNSSLSENYQKSLVKVLENFEHRVLE